jgi:hypothetical protein
MNTFDADASVSFPSRNRMVSAAPASAESWRSRQLPISEIDLMSQRSQRLSWRAHRAAALLHLRRRRIGERVGHHEDRGLEALGERVVALRHAARHLEVNALVLERLRIDQRVNMRAPLRARVRVANLGLAEAALEACEVLVEPERHARVHRHQLVHAVAEDEAAVEHRDVRLVRRQQLAIEENKVHFSHSLSVSQVRPNNPACATGSSATSGYSPYGLPSCVTRSTPTLCPLASGATSGCCDTSSP